MYRPDPSNILKSLQQTPELQVKVKNPLKLYPIGGHKPASCAILPTTRGVAIHGIPLNILYINIVETNVA